MEKDSPKIDLEQELHEHFAFDIDSGQEPLRIDKFLMSRIENATRNKIQKAAKEGSIRVNDKIVKSSYKVKKDDKILEIGTGSGYQTAVLCLLGAKVFSVERQNELFKITSALLPKLGIRPKHLSFGDGYKGLPNHAPFDSIIVTAGAPIIPKPLMAQLKIGGRLVIPVGDNIQIMTLFIRKDIKEFEQHEFGEFRFVPLLENKN